MDTQSEEESQLVCGVLRVHLAISCQAPRAAELAVGLFFRVLVNPLRIATAPNLLS